MNMINLENTITTSLAALLASTMTFCSVALAESRTDIKLSGSSTVAPVLLEIANQFEDQGNVDYRVFVESGGSSKGIADLRKGLVDIAMVSRDLKQEEKDINLVAHTIARDGIAVVVHGDNTVPEITLKDIEGIFSGNIRNWSELGGDNEEIVVISKAEGRATFVVFMDFFGFSPSDIDADVIVGENAQMIKTITSMRQGIGYVSIGAAAMNIELGSPLRLISLSDVDATVESVSNNSYQPTRPLNLVTYLDRKTIVNDLIAYSQSDLVSEMITELTFTPATK